MARPKAVRDHYYIIMEGQKIEVSREVYYAWYGGERQERYQKERQAKFGVSTFSGMGEEDSDVLEILPANGNTEEEVEKAEQLQLLHTALQSLSEDERQLLDDIFFKEIPVSQIAKREGVYENSIRWRRDAALKKLRKSFEK